MRVDSDITGITDRTSGGLIQETHTPSFQPIRATKLALDISSYIAGVYFKH